MLCVTTLRTYTYGSHKKSGEIGETPRTFLTGHKEAYAMKHDEQLTLFDGARNKLKQPGIKPHISELKQIENDLAELEKLVIKHQNVA